MNHLVIRTLEVAPVLVPLANPLRTASGVIAHAPLALIDLHTEVDGQPGPVGRTYVFTYTPLALKPVIEQLRSLNPLLQGQACAPAALAHMLQARFRLLGYTGVVGIALAGIDMAAWDACARAAHLPLVRMLGAEPRALPAYFSQGLDGIARGVELAGEALERGFAAMKIKAGYPTLAEDLTVVRAVQDALAGRAQLMLDYNQSLSRAEALKRCQALDTLGLAWIEEPLAQDDYAGHAMLARELHTPVQMGENWYGLAEMAQCIAAGGGDLAMPDAMKIGGVTGWRNAAGLAAAHGLPMSSHIFQEVSAHLLCATPTAHWLEYLDFAGPVLAEPMQIVDGKATPSERPGSGVEWNLERVEQYRVQ